MRHAIADAAVIICGNDSGLVDPERWVAMRVRDGRFPGIRIGRRLFMTDADIESALETCRRGHNPPAPDAATLVETAPAAATSITAGLSARARKLRTA